MGRHRLDSEDAGKWGGPDLVTTQDDRQSGTHPDTVPSRQAGSEGGGATEPPSGGSA